MISRDSVGDDKDHDSDCAPTVDEKIVNPEIKEIRKSTQTKRI